MPAPIARWRPAFAFRRPLSRHRSILLCATKLGKLSKIYGYFKSIELMRTCFTQPGSYGKIPRSIKIRAMCFGHTESGEGQEMRFIRLGISFFPVLLLTAISAERIATFLLGHYPSIPALWAASVELRSFDRLFSDWLDVASSGIFSIQIAVLAVAALFVCILPIKGRYASVHFLINHLALVSLVGSTLISSGGTFATIGPAASVSFKLVQIHSLHLAWSQVAVLSSGLLGCACCHLLFVSRMRKTTAVAAALTSLSLGLERRRRVQRNSVLHIH